MSIEFKAPTNDLGIELYWEKSLSQREIQALTYTHLLAEGFKVNLEYSVRGLDFHDTHRSKGRQHVSFDLVVFDPKTLLAAAIIVVKGNSEHWSGYTETRQERRYPQFGVPVLKMDDFNDVPKLTSRLHKLLRVCKQE